FFQLVRRHGSPAAALDALPRIAARGGREGRYIPCTKEAAEQEITAAQRFGATLLMYGAPGYPALLHMIADPPPMLTVSGNPAPVNRPGVVAGVGSRNASAGGSRFAWRIAQELGAAGHVVVSGLARGIDASAHRGALEAGTIAIIAGGIDNIYPPEN